MKKQIKKLTLNKKTISNLQPSELNKMIGGYLTFGCHGHTSGCTGGNGGCGGGTGNTNNGNTCPGHDTCYIC